MAFNPDLATRLAVAQLRRGTQPGVYLVWSLHCTVFVYSGGMDERVGEITFQFPHAYGQQMLYNVITCPSHHRNVQDPLRRIDFRSGSASPGNPAGYVTSLDFSPDASDGYDLLVGMSNGESKLCYHSDSVASFTSSGSQFQGFLLTSVLPSCSQGALPGCPTGRHPRQHEAH